MLSKTSTCDLSLFVSYSQRIWFIGHNNSNFSTALRMRQFPGYATINLLRLRSGICWVVKINEFRMKLYEFDGMATENNDKMFFIH